MKRRTFKTKRETLAALIVKAFLISSLICGTFAYLRWKMMFDDIKDQFERHLNIQSPVSVANNLDNTGTSENILQEFVNNITVRTYSAVSVFDIDALLKEMFISIFRHGYTNDEENAINIGSLYNTEGCNAFVFVIDDEGSISAVNKERMLVPIMFSEDERTYYSFSEDTSDDPEISALYRQIRDTDSNFVKYEVELDSIYINRKTLEFIPCTGVLKTEQVQDGTDLPENETKINISVDDKDFDIIKLSKEPDTYPKKFTMLFNGEKQEDIDRISECLNFASYGGEIADENLFYQIADNPDIFEFENSIVYLNGKQYRVFTLSYLNYRTPEFMRLYRNNVIGFSIIVLIIAALFCWWKNTRNKARYAMEDYRKDVTDHLAHDLKTPLMAIGGYAENILDGKLTEDEKKEYLEAIIENVEFADSTMSRTLMLNSMDGSTKLKFESIDVSQVVSETVKKYEPLLEQNNISFSLEGSAEVKAESTSFGKSVENLIANAVKYTPENGSIKVTIDKNKMVISNTVNVKIDTRKLKEPFVRGEESRSNLGGSGLGLSIAERAAALNGFRLNISCTDNEFKAEVKF